MDRQQSLTSCALPDLPYYFCALHTCPPPPTIRIMVIEMWGHLISLLPTPSHTHTHTHTHLPGLHPPALPPPPIHIMIIRLHTLPCPPPPPHTFLTLTTLPSMIIEMWGYLNNLTPPPPPQHTHTSLTPPPSMIIEMWGYLNNLLDGKDYKALRLCSSTAILPGATAAQEAAGAAVAAGQQGLAPGQPDPPLFCVKYIVWCMQRAPAQLFDITGDPYELNNM